jgi:transposase
VSGGKFIKTNSQINQGDTLMRREDKLKGFENQVFYIGIDVHKRQWHVTIRNNNISVITKVMEPSAEKLSSYLNRTYPEGSYYSVYEAGFSGYWIDRELKSCGIKNIIVAPTNIPTSTSEKLRKTDAVDSRKLARELEKGNLVSNYSPTISEQELRSYIRLRYQLVKDQTVLKNRIKGYLNFYGHKFPEDYQNRHWSKIFIEKLRTLEFSTLLGKKQMNMYLDSLQSKRTQLLEITREIKNYIKEGGLTEKISLLRTVPGIGLTTAVTLLSEIIDINRFGNFNKLSSYLGLIPAVRSSDQKEFVLGLKIHHNKLLRQLLVEAAWMAIRKDPALLKAYGNYKKRMSPQEAIIRIAKKLTSRIYYVLRTGNSYEISKG